VEAREALALQEDHPVPAAGQQAGGGRAGGAAADDGDFATAVTVRGTTLRGIFADDAPAFEVVSGQFSAPVLGCRPPRADHPERFEAGTGLHATSIALPGAGLNRDVGYVTGTPESLEKRQEGGVEVEVWQLRQDKGMKMGYFTAKAGESTGLPASVRFEDGKLVNAVESGTSSEFDLDN
jgi:hypothetical protein